jgi:hypothetical protein
MPNRLPNAEVSDTTDDDSSNTAGQKNNVTNEVLPSLKGKLNWLAQLSLYTLSSRR